MAQNDRTSGFVSNTGMKVPVRAATTATITLSGEQTVDGIALVDGDRVLVKNQTTASENGIYLVTTGAWTRAKDCDGPYDLVTGSLVLVNEGTVSAGVMYRLTTTGTITIGTTSLTFALYNAGGVITAIPVTLAQGGSGQVSAIAALAAFGVIQVTVEAGTANAQTGTMDAVVIALRADQLFIFTPSVANTGATTLALNALAAKNIFAGGAALSGGELLVGVPVLLQYDGTQFNIIGSTTGSLTLTGLLTTNGQIAFPVTQNPSANANTLDDYEEGIWTPSVGGTATYTTQTGTYTKIGRLVFVQFSLVINTIGTGSTTIVTGLPFTVGADAALTVVDSVALATAVVSIAARAQATTTQIPFLSRTAAATQDGGNAIFGNATQLICSGVYSI